MSRTMLRNALFVVFLTGFLTPIAVGATSSDWIYVRMSSSPKMQTQSLSAMASVQGIEEIVKPVPQQAVEQHPVLGQWRRIRLAPGTDIESQMTALAGLPGVEYAEPAVSREICDKPGGGEVTDLPNDPLLTFQWHLQTVNAFAAWDMIPSAEGVVIAILDNGVDIDHPDLASVIWKNQAEINGVANVDDDNNGYVDDRFGFDFFEGDGDPDAPTLDPGESPGHGTHCAGIAAAVNNNGIGISGLARGAEIMAVRIGEGRQIFNAAEGIVYAGVNGADVISMSFAGQVESVFERDAIDYVRNQGSIMVAAAGNNGSSALWYPAAYEDVIAVAATDVDNSIASFSNRGWWVQAAAPGVNIMSTYLDNSYGYSSGTSMAAPLVAGAVALLKAQNPDFGTFDVLARLQQGAAPMTNPVPSFTPAGVIDAWKTLLSDRPVVIMNGLTLATDRLMAGESTEATLQLELVGEAADNIEISVGSLATDLSISNGLFQLDNVPVGPLVDDNLITFTITAHPQADQAQLPIAFAVNVDGWQDTLSVRVPVDLPYETLDAGNMIATISDFGAIGYNDYVFQRAQPDGIRLRDQIFGFLYHGSVMIGDGQSVADNAYGNTGQSVYDFHVLEGEYLHQVNAPDGAVAYQTRFSDVPAGTTPVGVNVTQTATVYPDGDNILFLEYNVRMASGSSDLYFGIYCDWDIAPLGGNRVYYNDAQRLSYMEGAAGWAGVVALGNTPISSARAINNAIVFDGGYTDAEKMGFLTDNTAFAVSQGPSDWSHLIAVRLDNVGTITQRTASFAIIAADNEAELLALAAQAHSMSVPQGDDGSMTSADLLPTRITLTPAWPNPFNSMTRLGLTLDGVADVRVSVYDMLGRRVANLQQGTLQPGTHEVVWDGTTSSGIPAATGLYLIRATGSGLEAQHKVTLIK